VVNGEDVHLDRLPVLLHVRCGTSRWCLLARVVAHPAGVIVYGAAAMPRGGAQGHRAPVPGCFVWRLDDDLWTPWLRCHCGHWGSRPGELNRWLRDALAGDPRLGREVRLQRALRQQQQPAEVTRSDASTVLAGMWREVAERVDVEGAFVAAVQHRQQRIEGLVRSGRAPEEAEDLADVAAGAEARRAAAAVERELGRDAPWRRQRGS